MDKSIPNPYNFQYPVRDPALFAGRFQELDVINKDLLLPLSQNSPHHNVAIIGPRASGKTSLSLMILTKAIQLNVLPIYMPLDQNMVKDETVFFRELASQLVSQGKKYFGLYTGKLSRIKRFLKRLSFEASIPLISSTVRISTSPSTSAESVLIAAVQKDIESTLDEAQRKTKGRVRSLLIIIDEAQELASNEALLQRMRNVFQLVQNVGVILCGLENLFSLLSKMFSPIPRFFTRITLGPFRTLAEVIDAVERPLRTAGSTLKAPPDFVIKLWRISRALPYDINLICHFSYQVNCESGENHELNAEVWDRIFHYVKSYGDEQTMRPLSQLTDTDRASALRISEGSAGAESFIRI